MNVRSPADQLLDVLNTIESGRVAVAELWAAARRQAQLEREASLRPPPLSKQYEGRSHRGIARDWHSVCTDNDCWCFGSEHHNPRSKPSVSPAVASTMEAVNMIQLMNRLADEQVRARAPSEMKEYSQTDLLEQNRKMRHALTSLKLNAHSEFDRRVASECLSLVGDAPDATNDESMSPFAGRSF